MSKNENRLRRQHSGKLLIPFLCIFTAVKLSGGVEKYSRNKYNKKTRRLPTRQSKRCQICKCRPSPRLRNAYLIKRAPNGRGVTTNSGARRAKGYRLHGHHLKMMQLAIQCSREEDANVNATLETLLKI